MGLPAIDTLHDGMTAADDLLTKALRLSEVARIARLETQLRRYLLAKWNVHSEKAVTEASRLAAQLKPAAQIARAVEREMDRWAKEVLPRHIETQQKIYRLARTAGWKKANRKTTASLAYSTENLTEVVAKAEPAYSEILPAFDIADERAMAALGEHQTFWIGEHYDENIGSTIADTTKTTMVEAGKNRKVAGELIRERLTASLGTFSTPGGWHGSAAQYSEGLAANAATTARAFGQMQSFRDYGIVKYVWNAINDRRTCFQKNTLVLMADGSWKPIYQIRIGDRVITREGRAQKVTAIFVKEGREWSQVEIAGKDEIECTQDHFLGEVGGGWIEAGISSGAWLERLTPVSQPLLARGHTQVTKVRLFEKSQDAHDIGVEFDHSYVVWPGVPVHNCTRCAHLDGRVFTVEQGMGVMDRELGARTPAGVKQAHPFIGGSAADMARLLSLAPTKGRGPMKESASLAGAGIAMPPIHFRCRCCVDISTEVGSWEPLDAPLETPGYRDAKTVGDAAKDAHGFAKTANYKGASLIVANSTSKEMLRLHGKYGGPKLDYIGIIKGHSNGFADEKGMGSVFIGNLRLQSLSGLKKRAQSARSGAKSPFLSKPARHKLAENAKRWEAIVDGLEKGEGMTHGGEHTMYAFKNTVEDQTRGIVLHEYGHVLHFRNRKKVAKILGVSDDLFATEGFEKYQITNRAKDNLTECIAENFTLYESGHSSEIHRNMVSLFKSLEAEGGLP